MDQNLRMMNQRSDKLSDLPEEKEIKDNRRDWAQSKLFIYMYSRHTRHLIDSKMITLL